MVGHRLPLALFGLIHEVGIVFPPHGLVGGDFHHLEAVYAVELVGLGSSGTGHARQLPVHAEVVLQGNGGVGDALALNAQAFLGFHGLVQAVGPAAAGLEPPGELVDDDHLAVAHDIFLVALLHHVGGEGILHVVDEVEVLGVVQIGGVGPLLHLSDSLLGEGNGLGAVVDGVVFRRVEAWHEASEVLVQLHRFFRRAADDEWGTGPRR